MAKIISSARVGADLGASVTDSMRPPPVLKPV